MSPILARLSLMAFVSALALGEAAPAPAASSLPTGTWQTEDGRARIRTERCIPGSVQLCGYVVWLKENAGPDGRPASDISNPDISKRGRSVLGHQMLLGLQPDDEGHYSGRIYSGEDGKTYDVAVWASAPSALTVKGCMLIFCGTQTWKGVTDTLPGQLTAATDSSGGPRRDPEWTARPTATGSVSTRNWAVVR